MEKLTLYNVAKMYYIDNMGQQEIANQLGISRPQVSRILKEARETKIVDITLHMPCNVSAGSLALKLESQLNLKKVHIVEVHDISPDNMEKRMDMVTVYAAEYLTQLFRNPMNVGIGWGQTVYQTVMKMQHSVSKTDICFLPLVGNAGMGNPCYQTNSIVDRIAEKFKANKKFINAPAFISDPAVRQYIFNTNHLGNRDMIWNGLDVAYFSLGGVLKNSPAIMDAIGDEKIVKKLLAKFPVGDVLGNFINIHGESCLPDDDPICISIPENLLKKVPLRICSAIGTEKTDCIRIAAEKKFFNELITDSYTAEALIQNTVL